MGATGLGIMTAMRQVGGLLGLWVLAGLAAFRKKGLMMFPDCHRFWLRPDGVLSVQQLSTTSWGCCCWSTPAPWPSDTIYKTLMQDNVADEERGRAMGSWVLSIGVAPVGPPGSGGAGECAGSAGSPADQRLHPGGHRNWHGARAAWNKAAGVGVAHGFAPHALGSPIGSPHPGPAAWRRPRRCQGLPVVPSPRG